MTPADIIAELERIEDALRFAPTGPWGYQPRYFPDPPDEAVRRLRELRLTLERGAGPKRLTACLTEGPR